MSVRIHSTGTDPLLKAPRTAWQREQERGVILPMIQPQRSRNRALIGAALAATALLFEVIVLKVFA